MIRSLFSKGTPAQSAPTPRPAAPAPASGQRRGPGTGGQTYTRVFRWRLPEGETVEPKSVEIVGSFTNWKRVSLQHDARQGSWHGSIPNIPGGKTHHYMLLIDGKPTFDKACDGYAIPQGAQEEAYQLQTERGGRVLMLFAQAK